MIYFRAFNLSLKSFTRDNLGRIKTETETIGGVTTNYEYFYDELGQLDQVFKNGSLFADYNFDDNGNRTSATIDGTTSTGNYDNQDRLTSYGNFTFTYNRNGDLATKIDSGVVGTVLFDYDVFGNLKQVTLADGKLVEYLVDGFNRRVGKRVNGVLTKGFLYKDQLNPIVELDGSGNEISRFVYASKSNVPDYMIKGGVVYKIISDHLGSVRLVVNASSGAVAQRIDYDEWGVVLSDSSPGFQPFGFAGGLYDSDTGLVRFGARDYMAEVGRWTAKDPILFDGSRNFYVYVINDPMNLVDFEGEKRNRDFQPQLEGGGGAIGGVGGGGGSSIWTNVSPVVGPSLVSPVILPNDALYKPHKKNKRKSNKQKHQEGDRRRNMDRGNEKGDDGRGFPRKRPPGWKGPWPPNPGGKNQCR